MCAQTLPEMLDFLKRWLLEDRPSPLILYYAKIMVNCFERQDLPDWVVILAEGTSDKLPDVLDVARADLKESEEQNASHPEPDPQS